MSLIPFPDVPNSPGVPPLPRLPSAAGAAKMGLGLLEGLIWNILQVQTQWGIFDSSGNALGNPANFTGLAGNALQALGISSTLSTGAVEYSKETRVSDFPVERGGFASYNKAESPAYPVVTMCYQANEADRAAFLIAIDTACKSTNLYNVVTPEVTYVNYTLERYNYQRRSSRGVTLLILEIHLKEIRQVSAAYIQQINNPQNPGATPATDSGIVQPQTPNVSTLQSLSKALSGLSSDALATINQAVQ